MQRSANFASAMGHGQTPPELPEITDEAGDSPKWLPWLGLAFLALGIGCIVVCHTGTSDESPADEAAEIEAGGAAREQ